MKTREEELQYYRDYRKKHLGKKLAYDRAYYYEHREELKEKNRAYRAKHRDEAQRRCRVYYQENKEEISRKSKERYRQNLVENRRKSREACRKSRSQNSIRHKKWRKENPDYSLKQRLRQLGMTLEDYDKLLDAQHSCCAICGMTQVEHKKRFFIDHCHKTGKPRGLLCHRCNSMLGYGLDDSVLLRIGSLYLEHWKSALGVDQ